MTKLVKLRFRGCHSFLNEASLDLETDSSLEPTLGDVPSKVRHVAGIYGKNAGGKSNAIRALGDCIKNIRGDMDIVMPSNPFWLTDEEKDNSECFYELTLLVGNEDGSSTLHIYGYKASQSSVTQEYLKKKSADSNDEPSFIFEREGNTVARHDPHLGQERLDMIELAAKNPKKLIITELCGENGGGFPGDWWPIFQWCKNATILESGIKGIISTYDISKLRGDIKLFLCKLDDAISDIKVDEGKIRIQHKTAGGKGVWLSIDQESKGTYRFLELASHVIRSLTEGKTLIIDELDESLHPEVFARIIELFRDRNPGENDNAYNNHKGKGQLIFTAHNTVFLNLQNFRTDELHIADKNPAGISTLKRCSRKTKKALNLQANYLNGRLGSTPWSLKTSEFIFNGEGHDSNA